MSSLFDKIGGMKLSDQSSSQGNVLQNLPALQNDPVGVLRSVGLNIPANLTPKGIADYLVQSGQISGGELNHVLNTARMMGIRI